MRRRAIPKGLSQMQRVTITLDDDLLETLDSLSQRRGYNNRSEAIREICAALWRRRPPRNTVHRVSRYFHMFMNMRNGI